VVVVVVVFVFVEHLPGSSSPSLRQALKGEASDRRQQAEPAHRLPYGGPPPSEGVGRPADAIEPRAEERRGCVRGQAAVSCRSPAVVDEQLRPTPAHAPERRC